MDMNRDEAMRAKTIADKKLEKKEFAAARKYVLKAQSLYPHLEGLSQMLTVIDIYIAATIKVGGEVDWYGMLGIKPTDDDETLKKQYRKLALTLHPDKNKSAGADGAFQLLCEGWSWLSDKSKRLAYDQRRSSSTGFQRNVSMNTSSSSAPPRTNGFHNNASRMSTASKSHHTNVRMHPASVPKPSNQRSDTFWTICHKCKMHYEYMKQYLNHTLLCPNCHQAFHASETAPPFNYSKNSSSSSHHRHHNSHHHAPASNSFQPGRNASATSGSGHGDARPCKSNYGNFQESHFRAASVGSIDPSISAKAANVVQQAHERMKRERDGSQDVNNITFAGEGLCKKLRLDNYGSQHAANLAYNCTANGVSGLASTSALRKNGSNPCFNGTFNKPNGSRDLAPFETRNMLMEKARTVIIEKLNEWRSHTATKSRNSNKFKERKTEKRKGNCINSQGHDLNGTTYSSGTFMADQAGNLTENVDVSVAENHVASSMDVPDPDFHDFDQDRSENSFGENQVWAAYDNDDGMPRIYAMINKVISRKPFKVRINWLNSKTNTEFGAMNWVSSGFYKACGEFRHGKHDINRSINSFSHRVQWNKGPRGVVQIFPKKGETWAIYRYWASDWNEHTPDEVIHKYDMIVVLDDYNVEEGVSVAPLLKVSGFKTLFIPCSEPEKVMRIPREEMFRFSHQVAYYTLTGNEAPNIPRGCLELDPASTPLELLQVSSVADGYSQEGMLPRPPDCRDDRIVTGLTEYEGIL